MDLDELNWRVAHLIDMEEIFNETQKIFLE